MNEHGHATYDVVTTLLVLATFVIVLLLLAVHIW